MEKQVLTRFLSLDVLRGLTVALMIVVNTPGSWDHIYAPLQHAAWHGFTPTDLVYPTFLFVVGNALSFSTKKVANISFAQFFLKAGKRGAIIFIIGVLLNLFPFFDLIDGGIQIKNFAEVRIWGVLQRIAVCYVLGAFIIYFFQKTSSILIISVFILLSYWGILYYFGQNNAPYSLEGNAVTLLDNFLFNAQNLYQGFGIPFEPEGVLSTWPSIVNVLIGYLIGRYIQQNGNTYATACRIFVSGVILLLLAWLWNNYFPINKPIWTSSYVLYSLGWDFIIIAILIWIIEINNYKKWTYIFEVLGKNPLFIYILSWILVDICSLIYIGDISLTRLCYQYLNGWLPDKMASLVYAIVYTILLWGIGYWMDKKKIYIKV